MILLAALLEAAEPLPTRPVTDYLTAIDACIASDKSLERVDESVLTESGWLLKTTDSREKSSESRTYVRKHAAPVDISLDSDFGAGCFVEADSLAEGGQGAMLRALEAKFGAPARTMGGLPNGMSVRFWHLPHHVIQYWSGVREKAPFSFTVQYINRYPGTGTK